MATASTSKGSITVTPISGALGAEIGGVDLAKLDDDVFSEIHQAWLEHKVVFFRDQRLSPEQHIAFGRRFGELIVHPYVKSLEGHPEIVPVIKEPEDKAHKIYKEDPACGRRDPHAEILRNRDEARSIDHEERGERTEGKAHRLDDNARILQFKEP